MLSSLAKALIRSPAELRDELARAKEARAAAEARLAAMEDKCFRYAQVLVHTRAQLVAAKAMLEANGLTFPQPRRRPRALRTRGVIQ